MAPHVGLARGILRAMAGAQDGEDRYGQETLRLARLLASLARQKGRSIRSLEQQMGVADSLFHKVLKGQVTLQVRHMLMIADALGIEWSELFGLAYPQSGAPEAAGKDADFDARVIRVLQRLGLLGSGASPERPTSPDPGAT